MSDTLTIESIVPGGEGLARHTDGYVVFVPRAAPGDVVEVEYTEQHKQWRRARLVRVVQPGPGRREPPCPYYERCGGCQLQHLHDEAQVAAKSGIVVDCLQRIGRLDVSELDVEPSPSPFAYRNRISLVARASTSTVVAGYHAFDNPDELVDVTACPLAEDALNATWATLREVLRDAASRKPFAHDLRLTLRASAGGQVGLAVEGAPGDREWLNQIGAVGGLDAMWWMDSRGAALTVAGRETLIERWGDYEIPLAGMAFLQVNREAAALLDTYVVDQCRGEAGRHIVDAYCGFGLRALELARSGAVVIGIDLDRHAIAAAADLAARAGIGVGFIAAAVEHKLPRQLPADIVVLNPPRRGVDRRVAHAIAKHPPRRVIYVSCNPATLARDIKAFGDALELSACRSFDLFPQTAHVETVATLTRVG